MTFDEFKEDQVYGVLWVVFVLLTAPIWIPMLLIVGIFEALSLVFKGNS